MPKLLQSLSLSHYLQDCMVPFIAAMQSWHSVPLPVLSVHMYVCRHIEHACLLVVCLNLCVCVPHVSPTLLCPVPQIEQTADGKPVNLGESKLWGAKRFLGYTKQQPSPREVCPQCMFCAFVWMGGGYRMANVHVWFCCPSD